MRQGGILDKMLREYKSRGTVLALNGWQVHGTDLSPNAIEQAKQNAESFGVTMSFGVADFRSLAQQVEGMFDAVICCWSACAIMTGLCRRSRVRLCQRWQTAILVAACRFRCGTGPTISHRTG